MLSRVFDNSKDIKLEARLSDGVLVIMIVGKRQHHHLLLSSRLPDCSRVVPASVKLLTVSIGLMHTVT